MMCKMYRIFISIVSFIGALVMGFQHNYVEMVMMLAMSILFFIKRNYHAS